MKGRKVRRSFTDNRMVRFYVNKFEKLGLLEKAKIKDKIKINGITIERAKEKYRVSLSKLVYYVICEEIEKFEKTVSSVEFETNVKKGKVSNYWLNLAENYKTRKRFYSDVFQKFRKEGLEACEKIFDEEVQKFFSEYFSFETPERIVKDIIGFIVFCYNMINSTLPLSVKFSDKEFFSLDKERIREWLERYSFMPESKIAAKIFNSVLEQLWLIDVFGMFQPQLTFDLFQATSNFMSEYLEAIQHDTKFFKKPSKKPKL